MSGHRASSAGQLPQPLHDAAAAALGSAGYVFGGGEPSLDSVIRSTPGGARRVGTLPAAGSDVGAAAVGGTAYIVGGYTGTQSLNTIVAWRPGSQAHVVARIPVGLRYAGVTAAAGKVIVAGGTAGTAATRAVYSFDPATRRVTRIAELPRPLTHAAAAAVGRVVYVMGGRGPLQGTQVSQVLAIDTASGRVTRAGKLPVPASDMGAGAVAGHIVLAGGRGRSGAVMDDVFEVTPAQ